MAILNPYQEQQYQQYQQQQVFTAPPDKLLLMLFDGALRFCQRAEEALLAQKLEESNHYLQRVQEIILELRTSLNQDFALAAQLGALYDFLYQRLVEVNMQKDPALLTEVVDLLTELRQLWAEVAQKAREARKLVVGGGDFAG